MSDSDEGLFVPPPGTSRRGARLLTGVAALLTVLAVYVPPVGAVAMAVGVVAHVKGERAGLWVAVAAGVTTVAGTALVFLTG